MHLSEQDRVFMRSEIHDILQGFGQTITFLEEKDDENSFNTILQEYNDRITVFNEYNVPTMRYDYQADMEDVNTMDKKNYGDRRNAILCYKVSMTDCEAQGFKPLATMDVILDDSGDLYYIEKVAVRIGEYLVWIRRYPQGSERMYYGITKIPTEETAIKKKENPYKNITKIDDWLYDISFDGTNYSYARKYFDEHYGFDGACTAVYKDGLFGKNFDWYYSNAMNFVVRVEGSGYKSIGITGGMTSLTKDIVSSGEYNDMYKMIPFFVNDGINEKGVFVGINVVPYGDYNPTTGTNNGEIPTCVLMLNRMILDKCANVSEALQLISNTNIYCSNDDVQLEFHLIVGDSNNQYFVEFINNQMVISEVTEESSIMTNFYLADTDFNDIYHTSSPRGTGVERYLTIRENMADITDMDSMLEALYGIRFTLGYTKPLLSEFVANYDSEIGDLRLSDVVDNPSMFDDVVTIAQSNFENRDRNTAKTWSTRHSAVYDINNLTLKVRVEEDEENVYSFSL